MSDHRATVDLDRFVRTRGRMLRAIAARLAPGRGPHDVDDLVQEALARACAHREHFQSEQHLANWFATVVRTIAADDQRSWYGRRVAPVAELPEPAETGADPADVVVDGDRHQTLRRVLAVLSEPQRQTLWAQAVDDVSLSDLARQSGVPAGTVRAQAHRARAAVRAELARLGQVLGLAPAVFLRARLRLATESTRANDAVTVAAVAIAFSLGVATTPSGTVPAAVRPALAPVAARTATTAHPARPVTPGGPVVRHAPVGPVPLPPGSASPSPAADSLATAQFDGDYTLACEHQPMVPGPKAVEVAENYTCHYQVTSRTCVLSKTSGQVTTDCRAEFYDTVARGVSAPVDPDERAATVCYTLTGRGHARFVPAPGAAPVVFDLTLSSVPGLVMFRGETKVGARTLRIDGHLPYHCQDTSGVTVAGYVS